MHGVGAHRHTDCAALKSRRRIHTEKKIKWKRNCAENLFGVPGCYKWIYGIKLMQFILCSSILYVLCMLYACIDFAQINPYNI